MTEQEVTSSPSSGQSPLDLSLIEEVMTGQKSPSLLDPPSRKRKLSSAAGSAEQERQNEKEARIASGTHLSGSSTPNSEGSGRLISDDESNPQSEGTNGAPQTAPQTIARKHEHLTSAIASQAQEHEVRRHEIGLQGVMIKDKVDMVVAHKREKSKRLTNENIQILERKQQTLGKSDNVTSGHDMQYLPTLKHVSYKPEPISKLDIVPLIGDVNDGTPPPTQGHSTYGIGKGFKSLEMPSTSEGQPTYRIGKFPQTLEINNQCRNDSTCGIGERLDNPELSADNLSLSTPDNLQADNPSVSTPDHLSADNPSVSTPDHLSADNPSVSAPDNLPADNLSVSTPGNLPVDNPSVSTSDNLPADNLSVSTPGNLPADNPSVSTPDSRSSCIGSNISVSKYQPSPAKQLPPHYDSTDLQNDLDYQGWELPEETVDEILRFFGPQTDEHPASAQQNNSVTVSSNALNVTPSAIDRNSQESSNVSIIASFRHSISMTSGSMCQHTTLKQCWLKDFRRRVISLLDTEGNEIQTINLDFTSFGFAMTGGNKLLMTNSKKCINQILLPQNTVSTAFCTPYVPFDICVSHAGEILVTMIDKLNQNNMPRQSFVVKYTSSGQEVGRSQMYDQFGNRLLVVPLKVGVNHEGDRVAVTPV